MAVMKELVYSKEHEWVKVENGVALIGISDYAQEALGEIVFVELPNEGDEFSKGDGFGVVESVKAASDVYVPVSGKVVEVNEAVADDPSLVNSDPYGSWLIKVKISDANELSELLSPDAYEKLIAEEE